MINPLHNRTCIIGHYGSSKTGWNSSGKLWNAGDFFRWRFARSWEILDSKNVSSQQSTVYNQSIHSHRLTNGSVTKTNTAPFEWRAGGSRWSWDRGRLDKFSFGLLKRYPDVLSGDLVSMYPIRSSLKAPGSFSGRRWLWSRYMSLLRSLYLVPTDPLFLSPLSAPGSWGPMASPIRARNPWRKSGLGLSPPLLLLAVCHDSRVSRD
jgi:hypothetical protein